MVTYRTATYSPVLPRSTLQQERADEKPKPVFSVYGCDLQLLLREVDGGIGVPDGSAKAFMYGAPRIEFYDTSFQMVSPKPQGVLRQSSLSTYSH